MEHWAGRGPLTEFFESEFSCPHTMAKAARILKMDPRDLASFEESYSGLITAFGDGVTPIHFVASTDRLDLLKVLVQEGWSIDLQCGLIGTPLCVALDIGSISVARKLIEFGASIKDFTWHGKSPMFFALSPNKKSKTSISAVKVLYEAGLSLDAPCQRETRARPLHVAVVNSAPKVVSYLLQMGADSNIKDHSQATPMHYAASENKVEMIALLMKHRVKLDIKDSNGNTPLTIAMKQGKVETIAAFVENGFKINGYKHSCNMTLLQMAVSIPNFEKVEYLIKSGANPNARSVCKPLSLHPLQLLAGHREERNKVSDECLKVLDYLVAKGANVNCAEHLQDSPLVVSMFKGFLRFAKAIIGHGAKINGKLSGGHYLFHHAVKTNRNIIFTFLEFGGDYNVKNSAGLTPYHLAIKEKVDLKFIKSFIDMGCPYNQMTPVWTDVLKKVNSQEIKQFFEAQRLFFKGLSENNLELLVKTSVEKGAIPTGCSEEMKHPLHFVVSKGFDSLAAFLLENNCPPNSLNDKGESPLHIAARKGNLTICSTLLKYGARYDCTSKKCLKTPAKLAEEKKHTNVQDLFQQVARMFHLAKKKPKLLVRKLSKTTNDDYLMFANATNSFGQTLLAAVLQNEKNLIYANAMMALRHEREL